MGGQKIGQEAENFAVKYLISLGYKIIERNFRPQHWHSEIDIIAHDKTKNCLVFVEVKYRKNSDYGSPLQSVNYFKQKNIIKTAMIYLKITKPKFDSYRFDVLSVMPDNKIEHIQNAFGID